MDTFKLEKLRIEAFNTSKRDSAGEKAVDTFEAMFNPQQIKQHWGIEWAPESGF